MKLSFLFALFALIPATGSAQLLSFGVQGGFPTQTPTGGASSKTAFTVGPTVDLRISSSLSVQSGVLFHSLGQREDRYAFTLPENGYLYSAFQLRGRALEIPILLKYSFLSEHRNWRPFLMAGPSIRRTSLQSTRLSSVLSGSALGSNLLNGTSKSVDWKVDPTVAAGVSFRTGRMYIEPQFRYSYWGVGTNTNVVKNQTSFLLGFRF